MKQTSIFKQSIKFAVMFVIACTGMANAQVGQQWKKNYSYEQFNSDIMNDMAIDKAGNVYVTGESSATTTKKDYATLKYNVGGTQVWAMRYDGFSHIQNDQSKAIVTDNSGNVFVTGISSNPGITGDDIVTIKYNSAGVEIWNRVYHSSAEANDRGTDISLDASGNVYITGTTVNAAGNSDVITIKYNAAGTEQWVAKYHSSGTNGDYGNALETDALGNVYVAGTTNADGLLLKYNSAGIQQWAKSYNYMNGSDMFKYIKIDASGNIYAGGEASHSPYYDFALVKYNASGVVIWSKNLGSGNGHSKINGMALDGSGNIYVTGEYAVAPGQTDYATVKYNSAGVQQWLSHYSGADGLTDIPYAIAIDNNNNVYVTGSSSGTTTNKDFATVKYNSAGVQQWVMKYDGTTHNEDYGKSIAVDTMGNVIVSGITHENASPDYCTIKYTPLTGTQIISGEIPLSYSLSQNYPNPFNPATNINFSLPKSSNVKLVVFDITGKVVSNLVDENLQAGSYKFDFDASKLSSGTYFYKLTAGDYSDVKKMILVK